MATHMDRPASKNKIIVLGGGKGGVAKSHIAVAEIDALLQLGCTVAIADGDYENPDVFKTYFKNNERKNVMGARDSIPKIKGIAGYLLCNLREKDGFIELSKFIEHNPDVFIVVNTPAGATQFLVKYGNILAHVAMVMKRDLIMVWPINRQRDSVELLADFVGGSTGFSAIYVFKNAYFGAEYKFSIYDNSKIKARVTATLMFPELDDMIADALAGKRLAPSMAPPDFGITDHYILDVYRREAAEVLKVLHE